MTQFVTHEELAKALADAQVSLEQLPLKVLQRHLESNWFPKGDEALLRKSVTTETIGTLPHLRITRTAAQTLTSGSLTAITFTAEEDDSDALFTGSDDTITIRTAGRYFVTAATKFAANAGGGHRTLAIYRDGVQKVTDLRRPGTGSSENNCMTSFYCGAGSVVEARAVHDAGTDVNITDSVLTLGWLSS